MLKLRNSSKMILSPVQLIEGAMFSPRNTARSIATICADTATAFGEPIAHVFLITQSTLCPEDISLRSRSSLGASQCSRIQLRRPPRGNVGCISDAFPSKEISKQSSHRLFSYKFSNQRKRVFRLGTDATPQ